MQAGARPRGAVQGDPAADRLNPVFEPGQAGAPGEVGAAGAVVADRDPQDVTAGFGLDGDGGGAGVLGRVGQRLGDQVICADLDLVGQPPVDADVGIDRDRAAAGACTSRCNRGTMASSGTQ